MEKKDKVIYVLMGLVFVLLLLLFWRQDTFESRVDEYKGSIDTLKQTEKILREKVDSFSVRIDGTKTVINNIHVEKEKAVTNVKQLKNDQLQGWFTNRYGK